LAKNAFEISKSYTTKLGINIPKHNLIMSQKRSRPSPPLGEKNSKKTKRGFQVGPSNLPDGTYRRKGMLANYREIKPCLLVLSVEKIKQNLVRKAQLKKDLARARAQEKVSEAAPTDSVDIGTEQASIEPHPDRQALMDASSDAEPEQTQPFGPSRRWKRPKTNPFNQETQAAQRHREEAEQRKRIREDAEAQRKKKIEDRHRMQKAMAKARKPGRDGKRKLGRESAVLLEKVKKLMTSDI
jgi:hypothetical protein